MTTRWNYENGYSVTNGKKGHNDNYGNRSNVIEIGANKKAAGGRKTRRSRKAATILMMLVIVLALALSASAKTSSSKSVKGKKKAAGNGIVKVAVVDRTEKAAAGMMRWARYCGFHAVFVNSTKVNPNNYDGLLVPGGGDVDPRIYGKKRDPHTYGTDYARSKLQVAVILKFAEAGKPVLGICGGEQTINVAFGGTLKQHIGWHTGGHAVKVSKKSWLYGMMGESKTVTHFHHQCVDKVGDGLIATMWGCDNKEIEAVEHTSLPIYGVQWHPDQMGGFGKQIGQKFMNICRKYKK